MKNNIKSIVITGIIFALVIAATEFVDIKFLSGNIWEYIGIFLIGAGLFVIVAARLMNKKPK